MSYLRCRDIPIIKIGAFMVCLGAGSSFYITESMDWWHYCGTTLPDLTQLGLDFAIACTFIALVVPEIKSLATLVSVLVAAVAAVVFSVRNFEFALISAVMLAMFAGYIVSKLRGQNKLGDQGERDGNSYYYFIGSHCPLYRYLFLEGKLPLKLSENAKTLLSYSAPAVLTAIAAPIVLFVISNLRCILVIPI